MNQTPAIEPIINGLNAPFWEAAERGELLLQWCEDTRRFFWPPGPVSPYSIKSPVTWKPAPATGTLRATVIYRRSYLKELEPIMPYAVGVVELDAGPRIQVHVRDLDLAGQTGQRVVIRFESLLPGGRPVPMAQGAQG